MKIDFFISSLSGGGAEKVLITIATKMAEIGHEVSIISLEKRPQFYSVPDNITLIKYQNCGRIALIKDQLQVQKRIKKSKADVSISFLSRCNWIVLLSSLLKKNKVIVCDRNNPIKEHSKFSFMISNLLYHRADRVAVQTKQIKALYWKNLQSKIEVIENPIDTAKLDTQLTEKLQREKTILSMGRFEQQKDFKTLIIAFSKISQKYPEWKMKIFGKGNMQDELQSLICSLGQEEQIILCGRTENPYAEMCRASIFVLSSFFEGFPNVLCEAMYAGDLCIASDCVSGPRELIHDGENGWLFPVGDVEYLTKLLDAVLLMENDGNKFRENAKRTVKRLYLDKIILKWTDMIHRTVNS